MRVGERIRPGGRALRLLPPPEVQLEPSCPRDRCAQPLGVLTLARFSASSWNRATPYVTRTWDGGISRRQRGRGRGGGGRRQRRQNFVAYLLPVTLSAECREDCRLVGHTNLLFQVSSTRARPVTRNLTPCSRAHATLNTTPEQRGGQP